MNRTLVEGLCPLGNGELVVIDSEVPSFGVRVLPSGVKSYFVRYRVWGGRAARSRRESLGLHPVMTPDKARKAARDLLAMARRGDDPTAEKTRRQGSLTIAQLVAEWVGGPGKRTRKGRPKSAESFACDKARLEQHVVPSIGRIRLCDLDRSHVELMRDAVASGKTAKPRKRTKARGYSHVRGGETAATRTVATLSTLLGYAVEREYITKNPALGVQKPQETRCERFLSPREILALQTTLEYAEGAQPKAVSILRLLLLTGCRYNEIAQLRWSEVDLHTETITLQKGKNGPRNVYISRAASDVLRKIAMVPDRTFVFPATKGDAHYQGTRKIWQALRRDVGLEDVRIHDLRHTFASTALATGASLEEIAKLLGHAEIRTTARYAHLANSAVRAAANRVGEAVSLKAA